MPTLVIFWCVCVCVETILLGVRCEDLTLERGVLHTPTGGLDFPMPGLRLTRQQGLSLPFPHDQRSQVILADLLKSLGHYNFVLENP